MKPFSSNKRILLFFLCIAMVFSTCKSYFRITQTPDEFLNNKEVTQHLDGYNVVVHDPSHSYVMLYPKASTASVFGVPKLLTDQVAITETKNPGSKKLIKKHRKDVNIYVSKELFTGTPDNTKGVEVEIKKAEISRAEVYGVDKKSAFGGALAVLLIVLLVVGLLGGLVYALALGSQAGGTASGNASGNSSGNSNSNSGGNNGGNNGGGSNSSGGGGSCYIATMVYGSYDAPEVLVLRQFRDQVLAPNKAGRAFIKFYYRYSPSLVEKLRGHKKTNLFIRKLLDKWVNRLSQKFNG